VRKSAVSILIPVLGAIALFATLNRHAPLIEAAPASEAAAPNAAEHGCADAPAVDAGDDAKRQVQAIEAGDRIKLGFYEILESADEKWGGGRRAQEPAKGIQLRGEFSHEYQVREDGTISIPILGSFVVGGRATDPIPPIACAFNAFLGKQGFVNLLSIEKQPIYVVGKVKNSGSFDYAPGMTVLHAVALAGGFDKAVFEPWQVVDMTRGSQQLQHALDRAARMIARAAAIETLRSAEPAKVPEELSSLVGERKAANLVSEELLPRKLALASFVQDEKSLQAAVDSASAELELRKGSLPLLQEAIALRQDRVANLKKLADSGAVGRPVLVQAQSELIEAQNRQQDVINAINVAEDRLNKALQQQAARRMQEAMARQTDLATARQEATREAADGISASKVMEAIAQTGLKATTGEDPDFFIIRRADGVSTMIRASETTQLRPGDLVQVKSASGTQQSDVAINSSWSK